MKQCTDHLGNKFESITDMCKYWNIERGIYIARIKNGWTQEEALTGKVRARKSKCTDRVEDHLGNKFRSIRAMCKHWNVEESTYRRARDRGWTLEEALTGKTGKHENRRKKYEISRPTQQVAFDINVPMKQIKDELYLLNDSDMDTIKLNGISFGIKINNKDTVIADSFEKITMLIPKLLKDVVMKNLVVIKIVRLNYRFEVDSTLFTITNTSSIPNFG